MLLFTTFIHLHHEKKVKTLLLCFGGIFTLNPVYLKHPARLPAFTGAGNSYVKICLQQYFMRKSREGNTVSACGW